MLTIGTSCYDDFDGVYFTVTSLMLHHGVQARGDCEIVVVDNNPGSADGKKTRDWVKGRVPNGTYVPYTAAKGTAQPRNEIFNQAKGDFVLAIDCHVMLANGAIEKLVEYYDAHPDTKDLISGPLLKDYGGVAATHQRPEWGSGAWGKWSVADQAKRKNGSAKSVWDKDEPFFGQDPFKIWQQGMGLFSMRREAWVGFHPDMRGFGGCESYVMEKVRKRGGEVKCAPWLGWTHRFARPKGAAYKPQRKDKLRNYVIGFVDLGLPLQEVCRHFKTTEADALKLADREKQSPRRRPPQPAPERTCATRGKLAVIGHPNYGGTKLRGKPLAQATGSKLVHPNQTKAMEPRDAMFYIKDGACGKIVRKKSGLLVYDPLDVFTSGRTRREPEKYWAALYREYRFDVVLATSPACAETMRAGLPENVTIELVPHQHDPAIDHSWGDPDGPVVYAGLGRFVESKLDVIRDACRRLGLRFEQSLREKILKKASVVLALRCAPYDSEINRMCKPQIKIANAVAAGLPVVSTDDPAATSLYPGLVAVPADFGPTDLADAIQRARPLDVKPYGTEDFVRDARRILRCTE